MSALGTLLAAIGGLVLALPASRSYAADRSLARAPVRLCSTCCVRSRNWSGQHCC